MQFEDRLPDTYNLENVVVTAPIQLGNRGNNLLLNTVLTSPKRKAPESDGTSPDQPHTPPPKRQTQYNPIPPLFTPPADASINTNCTLKTNIGNLDRIAVEQYMTAYFERHSNMKTDSKVRLGSCGYLEDRISQYLGSADMRTLCESLLASDNIDWDYDGELLDRALKIDKVEVNRLRSQTKPSRLPPLPADQEAWVGSLMSNDDEELQRKICHLNRSDAMTKEERTRSR